MNKSSGDGITIMRYIGDETTVVIPAQIDGVAVLHLSPNAFADTAVRRVVLPEGFCCIQNRSFANCVYLEEIVIPASVWFIANNAFVGSGDFVIVTTAGSYAHSFAQRHGIPVRLI